MPKPKISEELIEIAVDLLSQGLHQKTVAEAIGIGESTWYKWLQKGEKARTDNLYRKLYRKVKEAEAKAIRRHLAVIQKAAVDGTWQAAAWILERRYPELWGKKDTLRLGTEEDGGLVIEVKFVDAGRREENAEGKD